MDVTRQFANAAGLALKNSMTVGRSPEVNRPERVNTIAKEFTPSIIWNESTLSLPYFWYIFACQFEVKASQKM